MRLSHLALLVQMCLLYSPQIIGEKTEGGNWKSNGVTFVLQGRSKRHVLSCLQSIHGKFLIFILLPISWNSYCQGTDMLWAVTLYCQMKAFVLFCSFLWAANECKIRNLFEITLNAVQPHFNTKCRWDRNGVPGDNGEIVSLSIYSVF